MGIGFFELVILGAIGLGGIMAVVTIVVLVFSAKKRRS